MNANPSAVVTAPAAASHERLSRALLVAALLIEVAVAGWVAWTTPRGQYLYDERFNLTSVARMIRAGSWLPTGYYWYSPPSFLPQAWAVRGVQWLASVTGWSWLSAYAFSPGLVWTTLGIGIQRAFSVLYGAVAVWGLARLGRRLDSPLAGGAAAFALATTPWFLRFAAAFKPDAMLLSLSVLAFLPLARYAESGRNRDLLLAAGLAGAATAAKLNGALLVAPLALAALLTPIGWLRRVGRAVEAAALAVAVYLLLSPFPFETLHFLRRVSQRYHVKGRGFDLGKMAASYAAMLLEPGKYLGPVLVALALAGVTWLGARLLRRRPAATAQRVWAALLSMPFFITAFLLVASGYPKENHLLQIVPFLLLPAAALVVHPLLLPAGSRLRRALGRSAVALFLAVAAARLIPYVADRLEDFRDSSAQRSPGKSAPPRSLEREEDEGPDPDAAPDS